MENITIISKVTANPADDVFPGNGEAKQTVSMTGGPEAAESAVDNLAAITQAEVKAAIWKQAAYHPGETVELPIKIFASSGQNAEPLTLHLAYDSLDDLDAEARIVLLQTRDSIRYRATMLILKQCMEALAEQ